MPLDKLEKISSTRTLAIWHVTETEEELQALLGDNYNKVSLSEIKAPTKRLEFLSSRALLNTISNEVGYSYSGVGKNEYGKPLLNGSNLELSISHSFPYVAVIIDQISEVGIDLEQPKEKIQRIAQKFCSESELSFAKNDQTLLCIIWSAKEALYKIYSKKEVIFNEHLIIEPFELSSSGTIDATIDINDYQKKVILQYRVHSDYVLVYNLN